MLRRIRRGAHRAAPNGNRWRRPLAIVSLLGLLSIAGVVIAAWLLSGSGEGQAVAGEAQDLTLTAGTPTALLFPDGTAHVATDVTNPNPFPVVVTSFTQNGDITSNTAGCDPSNHAVMFTTQTGQWGVAANSTLSVELVDAVTMGLESADACQGATFTIPLTVEAASGVPSSTSTTTTAATTTWYEDQDGDSFGNDSVTQESSSQPVGYVDVGGDCDDTDPTAYPGATEVADGVDNDCDGDIDDGIDTDADGLIDSDETDIYRTDPANPDSDSDGLSDGDEVLSWSTDPLDADTDDDGLSDGDEAGAFGTDPLNFDTDFDGLSDGLESGLTVGTVDTDTAAFVPDADSATTTDPLAPDSDGDSLPDGLEDTDRDGAVDAGETDPNNPDTDGDGLTDGEEDANADGAVDAGETDPLDPDTDSDGFLDGTEVTAGSDPLDPSSTP